MNIVLWVVQSFLAGIFLVTGGMKFRQSREVIDRKLAAVRDFQTSSIRLLGLVELLGGLGMILPGITGIGLILTPLAATGLAVIMIPATVIHIRSKEPKAVALNLVILAMTIFVAWHGFL
jgi:uncharacterized membrane protein YphA (DoxX/SURF4 family)